MLTSRSSEMKIMLNWLVISPCIMQIKCKIDKMMYNMIVSSAIVSCVVNILLFTVAYKDFKLLFLLKNQISMSTVCIDVNTFTTRWRYSSPDGHQGSPLHFQAFRDRKSVV